MERPPSRDGPRQQPADRSGRRGSRVHGSAAAGACLRQPIYLRCSRRIWPSHRSSCGEYDIIRSVTRSAKINAFLRGHYTYYGVAGNPPCLVKVYCAVERYWRRMLRSRSWAGRRLTWEKYHQIQSKDAVIETKAAPPICGVAGPCSAVKHLPKSLVREIRTLLLWKLEARDRLRRPGGRGAILVPRPSGTIIRAQIGRSGKRVRTVCAANSLNNRSGFGMWRLPRCTRERSRVRKRQFGMTSTRRPSRMRSG